MNPVNQDNNSRSPVRASMGMFSIAMMSVIAVDSLRTLPFSATYGLSLVFFYVLAGIGFLIPIALVAAELASGWPTRGGIYVWVRAAFGDKAGLFVVFLQWLYNVIWYPTILAFLAGSAAYLLNPSFVDNRYYMAGATLSIFWFTTLINCFGVRFAKWMSHVGAIVGTLLPMLLIIVLAGAWLVMGQPSATPLSWKALLPQGEQFQHVGYFLAVLFGLLGLEVSAVHADCVKEPARAYPRGFLLAACIIFFSLLLSSLAIAIVVPSAKLNVVAGLIQAFEAFFDAFHMAWMKPVIVFLIFVGGLGCVSTWVLGPARAMMIAAHDGFLPKIFLRTNQHGAPITLLLLQGVIGSILSMAFLLFKTVSSSYWLLSVITSQLAMIVYIILFAAAFKLKLHQSDVKRHYEVPGGVWGMGLICLLGAFTCFAAILIGFIPPSDSVFSQSSFVSWVLVGMIAVLLPPLFLCAYRFRK